MELVTSTNILSTIILLSIGVIGYFLRDKLNSLAGTDKRLEDNLERLEEKLERKIDIVNGKVDDLGRRVARIEGSIKQVPFGMASPLKLNEFGEEVLRKSEIDVIAARFKNELLAEIRKQNPKTAYDAQEATKKVFQEFNWGEANLNKFKNYAYQSGQWTLAEIFEVGAIWFRDIVLKELRIKIEEPKKE